MKRLFRTTKVEHNTLVSLKYILADDTSDEHFLQNMHFLPFIHFTVQFNVQNSSPNNVSCMLVYKFYFTVAIEDVEITTSSDICTDETEVAVRIE